SSRSSQCYTKPLDSLKNWNNRFFWVDECVFPTVVDWRTNASKDRMPANGTYSVEAVRALDTHRTPIQKQPELLLCLVVTAARVIEMDEPAVATDSSGVPSAVPPPEDVSATVAPEVGQSEGAVAAEPPMARESRSSHGGKSLAAMQLCMAFNVFVSEGAPADVSDPDPLSFADAPSHHPVNVAQSSQGVAAAGDPESENVSSPAEVGSPRSVYRPEWGVTNGSLLDNPEACQDLVAMGSQLRLRFEQEAKLLRKSVAQVARRDQRIQARESEIKNPEALLETEAGMKRAAEEKSAGLSQELERMRAQFSELQVRHERLSQQVDALQQQVSREETLKAAFEDYKRQQDQMVEQRCAEMDARLDALSIDFDEELYPHMLTAIAGRRWVIGHELRLAMIKYAKSLEMRQAFANVVSAGVAKGMSERLKHGVEHGHAQRTVESLEAYDPEAEAKFAAALHRAEQKKRNRIVCRTHGVGSAHHARSDHVPVSAPIVVPQGLALLLVDAATQTESDDA
nr:hypothetical protein [Tanacetum cinerariifolium]